MKLSVLIPTTGDREELLARVTVEHERRTPGVEVLAVEGLTWGAGLNHLAPLAQGDYLLCACDDILPHAGWFDAARQMLDEGLTPATRYFNTEGVPLRPGTDDAPHGLPIDWCRSFLLTPAIFAEVGPFMDATWYADIEYSERLRASGREIVACDGFTFTHLDGPRTWQTVAVERHESALYEASLAARS